MKKRAFVILLAGLMICLCLFNPLRSALGFGDFDSGSDYGSSDSSDSGSSSWGSDSSDWDINDSSDSRQHSKGSISVDPLTILIFIVIIGYLLFKILYDVISTEKLIRKRKEWLEYKATFPQTPQTDVFSHKDYQQLKTEDPDFSKTSLKEYVHKLFTEMQMAWENGDIRPVQYGFLPDTWERFNTQLQMKNQRNEITHVRDICFDKARITKFRYQANVKKYMATVTFQVAYNVWVTRKGRNIQGSPSTRHEMVYEWVMERPQGVQTPADPNHCPNCGAELDLSAFAECPFCHTKIVQQTSQWIIRDIQCLSQKTLHK